MRPVNLLPASERAQQGGGRPGSAYVVVGALVAVLIAVVAYVLTANQLTGKQEELAELRERTTAAQARAASLGQFEDFAAVKQTRLSSITALAQARLDWERLVLELARVLPENVDVTSLEASAGAAGADPAAGSAPTGQAGGPSLKLTGCAPSQPDVATLLVRLRKLHRAKDADLANSVRSAGDGSECGKGYVFTVDVLFDPAPVQEAPERVPAHLGGGA